MHRAEYWIQHLELSPHTEGGFFKETYRSAIELEQSNLPMGFQGSRRLSTSIYFLLRSGEISRFHRLKSDELWYYHLGCSLKLILLNKEGQKTSKILGPRIDKAEQLQLLIPAGTLFAAEPVDEDSFSLLSCMVAPGFEYLDFEIFSKEDLLQVYPKFEDLIERYG